MIHKYGLAHFLAGGSWRPDHLEFGLIPMIAGSVCVTMGSLVLGVPLGIGCAIFLAEIAPGRITGIIRPVIGLMAGIPTVVYGFYGLVVLFP